MNDFDFDVMQKKNVARGARHRKGGSKSKKCSLPSDLLTPAQKRALNGPVITVKLDRPINWPDYKALSESLKKEYLEDLIERYQVSGNELRGMLGCSSSTISRELRRLGVKARSGPRAENLAAHKAKWDAFCDGLAGGAPEGQKEETDAGAQDPEPEEDAVPEAAEMPKEAKIAQLRTTFVGVPSLKQLNDLFDTFVHLAREVTITIEITS